MPKPQAAHVGMQTVIFMCSKGDTHRVYGHAAHAAHQHEVLRVRALVSKGCPVPRPKPGVVYRARKGAKRGEPLPIPRCGAKVTERTVNHPTPKKAPAPPASAGHAG